MERREDESIRATKDALRAAAAKFEAAFQTASIPMSIATIDGGWLLEVNDAYCAVSGYDRSELIGRTLTELGINTPAQRQAIARAVPEHGIVRDFETAIRCRDGSIRHGLLSASTLVIDGQPCFVTAMIDITERKRTEEALRTSRGFLNSIVENIPDMIFVKGARDLRFVLFNRAGEELLGYTREELIGKSDYDFFPQDEGDFFTQKDREVLSGKKLLDIPEEAIRTRRRGDRVLHTKKIPLLDERGDPEYLLGISEDITERELAGEALQAVRRRLADIIEFLPDATFVIDGDGRVIAWNRAVEEMTGTRKEEILGEGDHAYSIPWYGERRPILIDLIDHRDSEWAASYDFLPSQGDTICAEAFAPRLHDGRGAHLWATASPLLDAAGNRVGAIESVRDVTERKRAEAEQEALQERLRQAAKMEVVGRLAGGMAHDFNNMLTAIRGYTELARRRLPEEFARERADLDATIRAADRAADLTRQMLAFAQKTVLEPTVLRPAHVVAKFAPMASRLLGEHITVELQLGTETSCVRVDPAQLEQVLLNLAVNARDSMPDGGTLRIATSDVTLAATDAIGHPDRRSGEFVALEVADTGSGIDPETQRRLFEPFFTTKEVGKGTGMGLATVLGIVKMSGGWIEVQSTLGQGTTFTIYLPKTDEVPTADSTAPALAPQQLEAPAEAGAILLVDDDPSVRSFGAWCLRDLGYRVLEASNGPDALEIGAQFADRIDLVVSDIAMPGMQGSEVAERMANLRPGVRILLCSGHSERAMAGAISALGVEYLQKPYSRRALGIAVQAALAGKAQIR